MGKEGGWKLERLKQESDRSRTRNQVNTPYRTRRCQPNLAA
jgi:hypothetical protein